VNGYVQGANKSLRAEEGTKPPGAEPAEAKAEEQPHDGTPDQTGPSGTLAVVAIFDSIFNDQPAMSGWAPPLQADCNGSGDAAG
jgi:hypothetical protein